MPMKPKSYTKIHWTNRPGLPECYRGGPDKDWHGPFYSQADAERIADSLMRVESDECRILRDPRVRGGGLRRWG